MILKPFPHLLIFAVLSAVLSQISCGVKGPPLPPLVVVPDKSEPQAVPSPVSTFSPALPLKTTPPKKSRSRHPRELRRKTGE